ncbi:helix-turn-helix domain-containing protein [Curtobacterium sp. MCLR17_007]|uniref:AraC family transcriptional regulator n=1 Tax=Curtobacterium sp. MCLR17_007 TaxID=2175648 RepID=UPI000DA9D892|nr:helix-turn-helix domain-containing protein [Curtobacterium sp. MCLR17_007]WIB60922.1 helix-turn-helix domain-containing protein [Curtobacterium sp. MCLR17_007]
MLTADDVVTGIRDRVDLAGRGPDDRRRVERAGCDRALAVLLYSAVYRTSEVQIDDVGDFRFRHRSLRDRHVELVSSALTTEAHVRIEASDRLTLGWTDGDGVHVRAPGVDDTTRPGVPFAFPTTGSYTIHTPPGVLHLVRIDLAFLETVDAVLNGTRSGRTTFVRHPAPARLADLRTSLGAVAAAAFDPAEAPRRRFSLQVRFAESVLGAFGARREPEGHGAGETTVGLARAWLAEHCPEPVALRDICAAAGVSARTLQSSFLRHTGSTPMTYLQEMRLDRVRIALQFADPHAITVGAVAREWGFRHMGRFAGTYFQRFREYPGETLRGLPTGRAERRTA